MFLKTFFRLRAYDTIHIHYYKMYMRMYVWVFNDVGIWIVCLLGKLTSREV